MDRPPHLDIDLNEAPSPPPSPSPQAPEFPPPADAAPAPAPTPPRPLQPQLPPPLLPLVSPSQQLRLQQEALEVVLRLHRPPELRNTPFRPKGALPAGLLPPLGLPAPHPGEAGWGFPPLVCASCGRQEELGSTFVCDACDRGFHSKCVRVWPPLLPPPPPPGPPGARRPRAAPNEDWICPQCEMRGARSTRWKLGPVPLDINAAPPEEPVAASTHDISRANISDGAQLTEFARLPHFEGVHLNNTALYDGMHFMPQFDLTHCLGIRQKFTSIDRDINADGSVSQRSIHLRRKRDGPQTSTLPKSSENHEFVNAGIFMEPSFFTKATEQSTSDYRSSLKPPKFLVEKSNHQPHHCPVVLPVQYSDFFITSLGEIDNRTSYHNSYQIWPVGFTSYWHDRVTGSLFECEVCDGGNFGPMFKVRRLPCSAFQLPDASTTVCPNIVRKVDTIETMESSGVIEDTANDTDDNISMLLSDFSQTNQDFLSCLNKDMEGKGSLGCSSVQASNMTVPAVLLHSGSSSRAPTEDANLDDKIGDFTFEGTTPSSAWRMISCAMMEACEKMYKEHGHLALSCTHNIEKPSFDYGNGSQNTDCPCNLLARFCSSNGPSIPRFIEKEDDVESACVLLKEWLYQDRIGFDLEFIQEIVESLPKSRACSNYQFLRDRTGFNSSLTIASGTLLAVNKSSPSNGDVMSYGRHGSIVTGPQDHAQPSSFSIRELPLGNPFSRKLPPELAGDVFQVLEFLGRFAEIIGLKELPSVEQVEDELINPWPICANQKDIQHYRDHTPPMSSPANVSTSYSNGESGLTTNEETASVFIPVETSTCEAAEDKLAAQTLGRCSGVVLPEIHLALLKVLFTELVPRVAIFVDPRIDSKESKSKRGRKRDTDTLTRELKIDMLTANKLTWPELARRYILVVSSLSGCMDLSDISSQGVKLFRCLQGDGGILCGALPGVVGMEKDALLLAEAETLICNSSANEGNKVFMMDYKDSDIVHSPEQPACDATVPDWVKSLEPVRKLPTNVGTRIRKCVYEALERKPPEWARKILDHSISKEVYKGNASGPTKKLVLSVLAEACRKKVPQNPEKPRKERNIISISDAILKKCRIVLRRAISSDESKPFGNLLGTTLTNSNENEDEGILGFPGMVSRPLDFRTIDIRLAMGAYRGSWEAFLDDVQEVIHNLQTAFADRPEVLVMVVALSQSFESLYKSQVQDLVKKFDKYLSNENGNSEIYNELQDALMTANNKLPKAPWEDGVCKVCGIDRDDESVLLCDNCDSEYHTYCLNPPLARIPLGNWYCPSCLSGQNRTNIDDNTHVLMHEEKKCVGEEAHVFLEKLNKLAMAMDEKEYWELSVPERIYLLKFLCDELLNTTLIREHLDQCSDKSNDLQQKLRYLNYELKELKYQVEIKSTYATQSRWMKNDHVSNSSGPVENQQRSMPTALEHLEDAERVNVGVNLNTPAEGAPTGPLNVGKPYSTDNDISSTSVTEGNRSLGLSKQASDIVTDRIDGSSTGEGSQSCEKPVGGRSGTCDNLNMGEDHYATVISTPNGELPDDNARTPSQDNLEASTTKLADHDADNNETNNLLDRISQVQDSISTAELQLGMASFRRECLGRDSVGRLYWITGRPGKRPRLVADGSMLIPKDRGISMVTSYPQSTFDCRGWNSASVVIYESDEEIKRLVDWLRDTDPREKDLKDSILHWQKSIYHQASFSVSDSPASKFSKTEPLADLPDTKAFVVLEQKYGLQLDQDTTELSKKRRKTKSGSEEGIYRCDCLEPVWPSRHHCLTCHETYLTLTEYEGHDGGKCNGSNDSPNQSKESDESKLKGTKSDIKEKDPADHSYFIEPSNSGNLDPCPVDFEEICKKFITNDSNKEIVKEIGLLGSNGVPSFVPSPAFFLDPPALLSENKRNGDIPNDWSSSLEECQAMAAKKSGQDGVQDDKDCPGNIGDEQMPKSKKPSRDSASAKEASSTDKPTRLLAVNGGLVPEGSLMPLIGRNFHILKQLKINLLDVEAALPEEALIASKSQQIRRRSWRAFVKGAESICHVVLATNFLQSMIKAEFLKKDWWYWSSFTAAIKTTTVSALALRIYTLDDCIMYTKDVAPNPDPVDNARSGNKGKRKRDADS